MPYLKFIVISSIRYSDICIERINCELSFCVMTFNDAAISEEKKFFRNLIFEESKTLIYRMPVRLADTLFFWKNARRMDWNHCLCSSKLVYLLISKIRNLFVRINLFKPSVVKYSRWIPSTLSPLALGIPLFYRSKTRFKELNLIIWSLPRRGKIHRISFSMFSPKGFFANFKKSTRTITWFKKRKAFLITGRRIFWRL